MSYYDGTSSVNRKLLTDREIEGSLMSCFYRKRTSIPSVTKLVFKVIRFFRLGNKMRVNLSYLKIIKVEIEIHI